MTVNPGVVRFQHYGHETVAQIQETLRAFQRVVGLSGRHQFVSFIEAMRQRVEFLLSQGKSLWRALHQRTDKALSRQSHLRLLTTRTRDCVYAILMQSEPFLHRIRHLYGTSSSSKTIPTMIGAAFAGLALTILMLLKMGTSDQAGNERGGTVKEATPSTTPTPDWTIFDDAFAKEPTLLATSEFVDRVRTPGAALTADPAETSDRRRIRWAFLRSSNGLGVRSDTLAGMPYLKYENHRNIPLCNIHSV
jgi:hypothetical protein